MIRWGTFEKPDGVIHVAPCWPSGYLLPPHVTDPRCECRPTPDQVSNKIWLHHDGH